MRVQCVLLVLLLFIRSGVAGIKVPAGVFRAAEFDEAAKQAVAQRKALAVVASAERTDASGTVAATEEAFKELKAWAVTVFVESEKEGAETFLLPPPVATALVPDSETCVPKVAICPPSADEVWASVAQQNKQSAKDFRKNLNQVEPGVKLKVAAYFKNKTPPALVMPGDTNLAWGCPAGRHYRGKFVKLEGENLYLSDAAGKQSGAIPLKDLSPASQRYAKLIGGAPDAANPGSTLAAPVENWQNKDGRIIRAAFVALNDGKITLKTEAGREYTVPVENLAATSQARARDHAAKGAR